MFLLGKGLSTWVGRMIWKLRFPHKLKVRRRLRRGSAKGIPAEYLHPPRIGLAQTVRRDAHAVVDRHILGFRSA